MTRQRSDDRHKPSFQRPDHGIRHDRQRVADEPELSHQFRTQADLVAEKADRIGPDGSAHLSVDDEERLANDLEHGRRRDAAAVHKLQGDPAPLELSGDLGTRTVHDDHLVPSLVQGKRVRRRLRRHSASQLDDDATHRDRLTSCTPR